MRFTGVIVAITFCLCRLMNITSSLEAADPPKLGKLLATDLSQVDDDFRYQGEYMGYAARRAGSSYLKKFGLQVIARGNGNFEAALYNAGLPGDGWDKQSRLRSSGNNEDGAVTFHFNETHVTVTGNRAYFFDGKGNELGVLSKYARSSSTMGMKAPYYATALFNGRKNNLWKNMNVTEGNLLQQGCETTELYRDFHLHLEFRLPYKPNTIGQDRGNSGVYLQRRYEVQVLDSFGLDGAHNECGGIYKQHAPEQNMCLAPLSWQTYDIDFLAARFDGEGNKTDNMKIRVRLNGIVIHNGIEVKTKTGAGKPEGPEAMPILLQDHGNPVRYRNIWLVKGDPFASQNSHAVRTHSGNTICPDCSPYGYQFNNFYYPNAPAPIFNPQVPQRMW